MFLRENSGKVCVETENGRDLVERGKAWIIKLETGKPNVQVSIEENGFDSSMGKETYTGDDTCVRQFPEDFKFGVATSAHQIEGAWNEDGKKENIWDHICHSKPDFIDDQRNGDEACVSYYFYHRDVEMLRELGVKYYKFSLSWTRLVQDVYGDKLNPFGVEYYGDLIQLLVENEIEPIVTLYHWDLPQQLEDLGGWLLPQIVDFFEDYARSAFEHFGDHVKTWITINDPIEVCGRGYGEGTMAPGIVSPGEKLYQCAHNLIKAHAKAWHIYDEEFRAKQQGRISITIDAPWFEPKNSNDEDDSEAAERALQFIYGWYANPIYKRNYPQVMIDRIGKRSEKENLKESRLPTFTEAELNYISGTYDFMGLSHYTTYLTEPAPEPDNNEISFWNDLQVIISQSKNWTIGASETSRVVPWGMGKLLYWVSKTYAGPEIVITGNGFPDEGALDDQDRISYFQSYLDYVLDSIYEDNVNVIIYIAWSLMDSFEWTRGYTDEKCVRRFPKDFKFGVATSAHQIEGAWKVEGKGENIWDHICHSKPDFIDDQSNGEEACLSYYLYHKDVEMLKELGVKYYKFSLSWARIAPNGITDKLNPLGVEYYRDLINSLVKHEIEPIVTLYHWDLPQILEDKGGWLNQEIENIFGDYARAAFLHFGGKVKTWITINDPIQVCGSGYGEGTMAPGIVSPGEKLYLCAHNLLKAHARAWHIYDEEFRASQQGKISITIGTPWFEPRNRQDPTQVEAAARALQFIYGWYANPIYKRNYPEIMIDRVANRSALEGFPTSRLPVFTEDELNFISGTHDFMGLNHFTTYLAEPTPEAPYEKEESSYWRDMRVLASADETWKSGTSDGSWVVPWGLREVLKWLKETYDDPEIIITGNGFPDHGEMDDQERISYIESYLRNVLDSILEDHVQVTAYIAWSLMDSFEWTSGYTEKFGLYDVDFSGSERTRTAKSSANFYKRVAQANSLDCDD